MHGDTTAYLNTLTLIAPALASFTHRHLKLDADRQAHELHRLASLRSGGFSRGARGLSKLLVLASRAPPWRSSAGPRVSSACAARPNLARTARASRVASRSRSQRSSMHSERCLRPARCGVRRRRVARGHREAARRSAHPSPRRNRRRWWASAHSRRRRRRSPLLTACSARASSSGSGSSASCSVISRRSAVVCTALVQERALQLLDAVAALPLLLPPPSLPHPSARGRRRGSRLRRRAAFDASRRRLAERRRRAAPGEDEARLRPVGATATGRRTDQGHAPRAPRHPAPRRTVGVAAPRGGRGGAARGSDEWRPSGHARGSRGCCCRCTLAPPAAHAAPAAARGSTARRAAAGAGASTSESHRLVRNDAVALGVPSGGRGSAALLASGLYGLYISAAIAAEAPQLLRADEVVPLAPCASGRPCTTSRRGRR